MPDNTYADFDLTTDEFGKHAVGHGFALTLEGEGRFFHRRCIKKPMNGDPTYRDSMLVGEIDGVFVYVKPPGNIIISKRKLNL